MFDPEDDERRRLAHELYDTIAQNTVALIMDLDLITLRQGLPSDVRADVSECLSLARQNLREMVMFCYQLHPLMIEELGLISVLRVYIESFSVRTGMHVEFEVLDSYTRVPSELEITLFRVACESLNSALQHLNSSWARVRLTAHATEARISLEYDIDPSLRTVIGHSEEIESRIRHIKERVQQLGGQITFQSADHRSVLEAVLPLSRSASATGV